MPQSRTRWPNNMQRRAWRMHAKPEGCGCRKSSSSSSEICNDLCQHGFPFDNVCVFACVPVRVRACVRAYTGASVSFTLSLHAMLDSTKHVEKKTKEKNTPHDAMGCTQAHLHILLTPAGLLNWALACEYVMEKRCPLVKQKIKLITCTTMSACFEPFGPKAFGCVM